MTSLLIVGAVLVTFSALLFVLIASTYNRLVKFRNMAEGAWSDTDVQLKRRYDLIPNVVETVRAYAAHESGTLSRVIEARRTAMAAADGANVQQRGAMETQLTQAIGGLMVTVEAYPSLKADQNFRELQQQLSQTEDAIQNARRYYNAVVRDLNTAIEQFPTVLFSGAMGFVKKNFFEIANEQRQNPQVRFS